MTNSTPYRAMDVPTLVMLVADRGLAAPLVVDHRQLKASLIELLEAQDLERNGDAA